MSIVWRGSIQHNAYLAHAFEAAPKGYGMHRAMCGRNIDRPDTACHHELCERCLARAGVPDGWADHAQHVVEALRWVADTLPMCDTHVALHAPNALDSGPVTWVGDRPVTFERYPDGRYDWEVHATYEVAEPAFGWAAGPRTAASIQWCPSVGYHRNKGQPDTLAGAIATAEARVVRHVEEALRSFAWASGPWLDEWMRRRGHEDD